MEEFIRNGPRYKQRESIASSLTPEVKAIIDQDLEDNRTKIATGQRKQQKKGSEQNFAALSRLFNHTSIPNS